MEEDPTGGRFANAGGLLNGAPNKLEDVINFHVGDIVTSLQRAALQPGGQEVRAKRLQNLVTAIYRAIFMSLQGRALLFRIWKRVRRFTN